jgi:hypothetical protein
MRVLEYIPLGLLIVLLGVLIRRRTYHALPYFFAYVAFAVVADISRFFTQNSAHVYYTTYWGSEAGYAVLGTLVMYEVLRQVLPNPSYRRWIRLAFPAALAVGIGLSAARSSTTSLRLQSHLAFYIVAGEIAVRFVQVIIFAGLVTLVPVLGLRWRQYPFGIATGFGVYSTVELLLTSKYSDFGTRFIFLWSVTSLVAYSLAVLIWIWFFSVPEKIETPGSRLSAPSPGVLEEYKNALRRMR